MVSIYQSATAGKWLRGLCYGGGKEHGKRKTLERKRAKKTLGKEEEESGKMGREPEPWEKTGKNTIEKRKSARSEKEQNEKG